MCVCVYIYIYVYIIEYQEYHINNLAMMNRSKSERILDIKAKQALIPAGSLQGPCRVLLCPGYVHLQKAFAASWADATFTPPELQLDIA